VTANVGASCDAPDNATLNFGSFDPLSQTAKDAETSITVRCTQDMPVSIDLDAGQNFATGRRRMAQAGSNANFLEYQLYTDPDRQTIWGTPAEGQPLTGLQGQGPVNPTRAPAATAAPVVYGRIFEDGNNQSAPVGNYSDMVTITVSF
jgi:spore coat protein U-like protein